MELWSMPERELHHLTHCPYRAWCVACVMGEGKATPRYQRTVGISAAHKEIELADRAPAEQPPGNAGPRAAWPG